MRQLKDDYITGHFSTLFAFVIWGVLPIFWKQLKHVPPQEILAHRIFWAFIFLLLINVIFKRKKIFELLKNKKKRNSIVLTAALISVNWMVFIFAVNTDHIVDASLGYFINPLVSVFLGLIFLKERMNLLKTIAVGLAIAGVLYLAIDYGKFPWISITLALSFGFYGMFKKIFNLDSVNSIMIETMMLSMIGVGYMIFLASQGEGHFLTYSGRTDIFLIVGGFVTMLPLFLFAEGARRIPLASVGFLQYFAPTLMLLIGVLIYKEPLTKTYMVSFIFIWTGLAVYTYNLFRAGYKKRKLKKNSAA